MKEFRLALPVLPQRLPHFDEIKGLAMIMLLLFHAGGVLVWNNYLHGDLGTDLFFIVSGLCLTLNDSATQAGPFLRRRLLRLLPAYWIVLTAYLILHAQVLGQTYTTGNIVAHYLGVHALFGDAWGFAINDSFWFLSVIFVYYGLFLATRRWLPQTDRFLLITAALSASGALVIFWQGQGALMGRWGFRMPDFMMGMLIGHAFRTGSLVVRPSWSLGVALGILLYLPYTQGIVFHPGAVALGLMILYVTAIRPWCARTPAVAPGLGVLGFAGRHSLEIFLIHQPLMREYHRWVWNHYLHVPAPSDPQLVIGIVISVAITLLLAKELHAATGLTLKWIKKRGTAAVSSAELTDGPPQPAECSQDEAA